MAKLARIETNIAESNAEQAKDFAAATENAAVRSADAARDAADRASESARDVADQTADIVRDTADKVSETVREGARSGLAAVENVAGRQREAAESATRDLADFASAFGSLFSEQAQENLKFALAFGTTTDWHEFARIQREFVEGSFARLQQVGERYRAALQVLFNSAATSSRF